MSEYCYQCLECGRFREDCICKRFQDPLEPYRNMDESELIASLRDEEQKLEGEK